MAGLLLLLHALTVISLLLETAGMRDLSLDTETTEVEEKVQEERVLPGEIVNCDWQDEWSEYGPCSASCGGGIATKRLVSRRITQQQDEKGYGRACPDACEGPSCKGEQHKPCALEPCPSDCSVVDLGNPLPSAGTAAFWRGGGLGCVYQFWHVDGKELKLLAETKHQEEEGEADPVVLDVKALRAGRTKAPPYVLHSSDERKVVLGFRSCREPVPLVDPSGTPTNIARVCIWGGAAFQKRSQKKENMSKSEWETLTEYRRAVRETKADWIEMVYDDDDDSAKRKAQEAMWAGSLMWKAGGKGVSDKTPGVTFEGAAQEATKPAYTLKVEMAASPPDAPKLAEEHEMVGGGLRLKFAQGSDNGAPVQGYEVWARRLFRVFRSNSERMRYGYCESKLVPKCQESLQVPCVDEELTLRHFALGSSLEVSVAAINSAGKSTKMRRAFVRFTAKANVPWKRCPVQGWTSFTEPEETHDFAPEVDEPQCRFDAPPVPQCRMETQKDWKGDVKCIGKRYWRTFRPFDKNGQDLTHCAGTLQGICTHRLNSPYTEEVRQCDAPGCSSSILPWKEDKVCCCHPSFRGFDEEEDCACYSGECASLGLVEARDEQKSCHH